MNQAFLSSLKHHWQIVFAQKDVLLRQQHLFHDNAGLASIKVRHALFAQKQTMYSAAEVSLFRKTVNVVDAM